VSGAPSAKAEGQEAPKKNMGKIMLLVLAALNIAVAGGGTYLAYMGTLGYKAPTLREPAALKDFKAERKEASEVADRVMYTMQPFTVNLAGQPRRLIRVEMTFEMLDKEGFEEIVRESPRARDEIVRILNQKSFDDVETIQGKLALKDQIAVTLNQSLKTGVVKDIYFNGFLVQ
jgi:flagellar protein FliL